MSPKYSAQERLKFIERVIVGREPVAKVCREAGISRVLFYRWLKRYKEAPGIVEFLAPGRRESQKDLTVSVKKRKKSPKRQYPELSPEKKLHLIRRVEKGEEVADVCREAGISRTIFYRWKKRYQQAPSQEKIESLEPHQRRIEHYFRQTPERYERAVLDLISQHPKYGVRKLVANLPEVAGVSIVGHHGVQNILRRHNLSLYEQRLAYAGAQVTPVTKLIGTFQQSFAKFFLFPLQTRRALVKFTGLTGLSAFATVAVLGLLGYLVTVFGQAAPGVSRLGLVFASIALIVGTFFFLYSMKYYFTLALVLSFSRQPGEGLPGGVGIGLSGGIKKNGGNGYSASPGWLAKIFGVGNGNGHSASPGLNGNGEERRRALGLEPNLDEVKLERYPFISIHLPLYNEKKVADRLLSACTSFDYPNYEVIVCDDSTDETVKVINEWAKHPKVKVLHRPTREGFKGGALKYAVAKMNPKTEFVLVFDADFVPYPDTLTQFMKYFKATGGWDEKTSYQAGEIRTTPYETLSQVEIPPQQQELLNHQLSAIRQKSNTAVVAGYQWHVLNKSENWITKGVRTEYAGSYVIERPGQEILGALKIIHGSVYAIRADVLKHFGWGTSITEDYELTLRIYEKGFKVVYTPYVQAPSECVSTIKRLIRQRMRWAEGHSFNTRKMFLKLLVGSFRVKERGGEGVKGKKEFIPSPLTLTEKLEFLYISPYYLQAFFFLLGTFSWLVAETVFKARLPFWTSLWGWSLVLTNFFALPLMNAVGLFLEESEEKDYLGLFSFVALSYLLVPFQGYAALKGFLEKEEGGWFRTPKTGLITDVFAPGKFYRWITGIIPGRRTTPAVAHSIDRNHLSAGSPYLALTTANSQFNSFRLRPKKARWIGKIAVVFALVVALLTVNLLPFVQLMRKTTSQPMSADDGVQNTWTEGLTITPQKPGFRADESPRFTMKVEGEGRKKGFIFSPKIIRAVEEKIESKVFYQGDQVEILTKVKNKKGLGEDFEVDLEKPPSFKPGEYVLQTTVTRDDKVYQASQEFSWGVLAINPNKSIYLPGEMVKLAMAVLDDEGNMVCDAQLKLKVKNQKSKVEDELSTENGKIWVNPECQLKRFAQRPDYEAGYQLGSAGKYEMELTAKTENGTRTIYDRFEVRESIPFEIERTGPTRIYPPVGYLVALKIKANQDFKGEVREMVPEIFEITSMEPTSEVSEDSASEVKNLVWEADWKKGETYELSYEFKAPHISPQFYLLGPLELRVDPLISSGPPRFSEARQWQIAADLTTGPNYAGAAGTNAFTNPANAVGAGETTCAGPNYGDVTESGFWNTFGFALAVDDTVDGILVEVKWAWDDDDPPAAGDNGITVVKSESVLGTEQTFATAEPQGIDCGTGNEIDSKGGATDLWGLTWTPTEVNATTFGVRIRKSILSSEHSLWINWIRVTVYSTPIPESRVLLLMLTPGLWLALERLKRFRLAKETLERGRSQ